MPDAICFENQSLDNVLRALGYVPADGKRWVNGIAREDGSIAFAPGVSDAYEKTVVWLHTTGQVECPGEWLERYRAERPWLFEAVGP